MMRQVLIVIVSLIALTCLCTSVSAFTVEGYESNPTLIYGTVVDTGGVDFYNYQYLYVTLSWRYWVGFAKFDFGEGNGSVTALIDEPNAVHGIQYRFTKEVNGTESATHIFDVDNAIDYLNGSIVQFPCGEFMVEFVPVIGQDILTVLTRESGYVILISTTVNGTDGSGGLIRPSATGLEGFGVTLVAIIGILCYSMMTCKLWVGEWFHEGVFMVSAAIGVGVMIWVGVFLTYMIAVSILLLVLALYRGR